MRDEFLKNKMLLRSGYLLIESLIGLIICVMGVGTIIMVFSYAGNQANDYTTHFYSAIQLIESKKFSFRLVDISRNDVFLYSPVTKKHYHLQQYQDMVRITGVSMGHIQTLTHVEKAEWHWSRGCLKTNVQFDNQQCLQAFSKLPKQHKTAS